MSSTPTPKETDAQKAADAQVGRADERLAHAYEEIKRADEQLTQMSERLAKIEGDTPRPAAAAPAPHRSLRQPQSRRLRKYRLGKYRHRKHRQQSRRPGARWRCCWRRASLSLPWFCRPMAAGLSPGGRRSSAQRDHRRPKVRRLPRSPRHPSFRWRLRRPYRCRQHHTRKHAQATRPRQRHRRQHPWPRLRPRRRCRAACRPAASSRSAARSSPVAAKDRARSRDAGAEHRAAQGEPAANGHRQFKSHWRAQGQPGRNETVAREDVRAAPAQGVATACGAAGSGRAQARADVSAAAGESAAAILPEGAMVLRRLVAAGAAIVEILFLQQRPARYGVRRNTIRDDIAKTRLA